MGIAEILAAKKKAEERKEESIFEEDILEDEIPYTFPVNTKFLVNNVIDPLFLAVMTPLIRSPYHLYGIHPEYEWWLLLEENHIHVLNTFMPISTQDLFDQYMKYNPPLRTEHLHRLSCTITRIQLVVTLVYLPRVLEIIEKESIKPIDSPSPNGYTDTCSIFRISN